MSKVKTEVPSTNLPKTVPILTKDALVDVKINYNICGAIAQSIFIQAENWKKYAPEKLEKFKEEATVMQQDKIKGFSDIELHAFAILDSFYKLILKNAKEQGMTEEVSIDFAVNPLG